MTTGENTYREILNQPPAWEQALAVVHSHRPAIQRLLAGGYDQVLFTGCGSTYYLSLAAARLFQEMSGKLARAIPAGELLLNPQIVLPGPPAPAKTLLVAVSRSGTTSETIHAVERFHDARLGQTVVISNVPGTPLESLGDLSLIIPAGQEQSVAQTRSFASMYVAATALCALGASREDILELMQRLPPLGADLLKRYDTLARRIGEDLSIDRFYFLGSGAWYGLACEVNLKMKEMTLTHSEAFHFLEFRHGPMAMVSAGAMIVGLLSERNGRYERAVLEEMRALGGSIFRLAETNAEVSFENSLPGTMRGVQYIPESVRGVLYLPVLQLMAYYRAMCKGLDPDRPTNLRAVIELDLG